MPPRSYTKSFKPTAPVDPAKAGALITAQDDRRKVMATFLLRFHETSNQVQAAIDAGVSTYAVQAWCESDPWFREEFDRCQDQFLLEVRRATLNRAIKGWKDDVFHNGEVVGTKQKYDSGLLKMLAKALLPELREKRTEASEGDGDGKMDLTPEEARFMKSLLTQARAQGLLTPEDGVTSDAKP